MGVALYGLGVEYGNAAKLRLSIIRSMTNKLARRPSAFLAADRSWSRAVGAFRLAQATDNTSEILGIINDRLAL
jgi:hypothetical protein